jgi:isoquinoline 1-oxidoreductase beta subunit
MSTRASQRGEPVLSRRAFFRITALAGTGLAIGIYLPGCGPAIPTPEPTTAPQPTIPPQPTATTSPTAVPLPSPTPAPAGLQPNIYVTLDDTGAVTVYAFRSELGQGIRTAIAMIIAEELDADWGSVRIVQVGADSRYGDQVTGGSVSVSGNYNILRQAGAAARSLLVAAAAQQWGIDPAACRTEPGWVIGPDAAQRLPYAELAVPAGKLDPASAKGALLKDPASFTLINTPRTLYDAPAIVTGRTVYGTDMRLPGMLHAVVARCPVFDGFAASFDATQAKAVPGVRDVIKIDRGVAVVAENTWAATQGRAALQITWDEGKLATWSSESIREIIMKQNPPTPQTQPAGLNADGVYEAAYDIPYLAHATMEPMNCVADVRPDRCEVWAPTQDPQQAKRRAQSITNLGPDAVTLHVTMTGGGFGRRHQADFVEEAVQISKAMGVPVQVFYTRDDDLQHDYYHPLSYNFVSAKLDATGAPTYMPSVRSYPMPIGVPTGAWRSVENFTQAFARESFLDEVAALGKLDPVEMRLKLLKGPGQGVVELAASKAGWGTPMPAGQGRGIAYWATFNVTHVAQVAEIEMSAGGQIRVRRVVCAVDCGQVINPDTVVAQMEGGIVFGLTAALKASITIDKGRVQQSNFNDYPLLPIGEMPAVEVYIVPGDGRHPSGIGEMGVPPIAPAVANAVFAATGVRVRHIPIKAEDLQKGA